MTYQEILEKAEQNMGNLCKACNVCNGRVCRNLIPGPGAKGVGDNAIRNYEKWQEIRVNMDTICSNESVITSIDIFGKTFKYPFFAGPVGAVESHYGKKYNDETYNGILLKACSEAGIFAFTGDGINPKVMEMATDMIKKENGIGIPTVKPWHKDVVKQKMELIKKSGAFAVAMDIDAAGLPFLKNLNPKAGSKSVEELKEIIKEAGVPFIVKGIMTVSGAEKAVKAGANAILVSNHGGRVLDQCAATAEVLPEIVDAVQGEIKILVDGGIRSGVDIFKALAIGADAVVIARPFVTMLYGAESEGIKTYVEKIGAELADTMAMCGAHSLKEIKPDMVRLPLN